MCHHPITNNNCKANPNTRSGYKLLTKQFEYTTVLCDILRHNNRNLSEAMKTMSNMLHLYLFLEYMDDIDDLDLPSMMAPNVITIILFPIYHLLTPYTNV